MSNQEIIHPKFLPFKKEGGYNRTAFTLVELIVTIAILAILGTIAFISLQGYSEQSRDSVRISDVSTIKTGLELYELDSGKYPEPTNGINITYSGSIVWNQGTFGETVSANVDKLDKKPIDPLTEKEYTYSVTAKRNEYELGGMVEGDEIVITSPLTPLLWSRGGLATKVQAGETTAIAYITGNYNGQMTKTLSGITCDVLSLPTIIANDVTTSTDLVEITNNKRLVYNGYKNLPSSFKTSKFKYDGGFDYTPNKLVVYKDNLGCATLSENETERVLLLKNLQENYSGTILENNENYKELLDTEINLFSPNNLSKILSRYLVGEKLGLALSETSITFLNCEGGVIDGYTYGNVAHGLGESVTKTVSTANGSKSYGALAVCNNGTIQITNENINITCDSGYVEQAGLCVQDVCNSTVPINAHSTALTQSVSITWIHNLTPGLCTFACDTNYTWNGSSCSANTQNTNCTSLPVSATWNTASNITQTWNGTTWLPIEIGAFNLTPSTTECNFNCNANYTWNGSSCALDNYTVTFDGNGGTGHTPTTKSVTYNTAVGTLPSNPTRAGYTFNGWFTATSGGTQVTTATVVTTTVTYYAQWTINNYTVTFDGNGGTGHTPTTKSVTYNTAVGTLPSNPTRAGYTFNGWFTATSGGTSVTTGTVVITTVTYYAQWLSVGAYTYGGWAGCSASCGGGTQTRSQFCGYDICNSPQTTSQSCNTQACPTSGAYSYGGWSGCSASCGGGIQTRAQYCYYDSCYSPQATSQSCNTQSCPNYYYYWSSQYFVYGSGCNNFVSNQGGNWAGPYSTYAACMSSQNSINLSCNGQVTSPYVDVKFYIITQCGTY